MHEVEVLLVKLREWLGTQPFALNVVVVLTPRRFRKELLQPSLGDNGGKAHAWYLMRDLYRILPYAESRHYWELHVMTDDKGRVWRAEAEYHHRWVIEFQPLS